MSNLTRRDFIKSSTILGLSLSVFIPDGIAKAASKIAGANMDFSPNAFVNISPNNTITLYMKHLEMGQGIYSGLSTILAEELEVSLDQVKIESAPANVGMYNNTFWGPTQGTGGSTGVANSYVQLRNAGATARELFIQAAAKKWKTSAKNLKAENGRVINTKTKKSIKYGDLIDIAKTLKAPEKVTFKKSKDFKIMGKDAKRVDGREKTNGSATFSIDVRRKNRATAVVARADRFGAKVKSFDSSKAKKIKGVLGVYEVSTGVAVVAVDYWTALKGRDALEIKWDNSKAMKKSSSDIIKEYKTLAKKPGVKVNRVGKSVSAEMKKASEVHEAVFVVPYLAHTPLEPLNCTMEFNKEGGVDVWTGSQIQTLDKNFSAKVLGLDPKKVKIHTTLAGGSFGRRANPVSDFVVETAEILKASKNLKRPIHLIRTREDDIRGGYYRPIYVHNVKIGLDDKGEAIAWDHKVVGQSIVDGTAFAGLIKDGVDHTSVEGVDKMIYGVPNFSIDLHSPKQDVPVLWWRSVGHTHTAFVMETIIDELAGAIEKDPVDYRLERLGKHKRHKAVLEKVAKISDWKNRKKQKGKGFGVAVHHSFNSYVAQVIEVTISGSDIKVDKVYCAVDCGFAVNPDIVKTQMEGGIGFGLSAALKENLEIKNGAPVAYNFGEYQLLNLSEMPDVEVSIVDGSEKPTGVGEPGVPPVFPALANAIADATGKRLRELPFKLG